MKYIIRLLVKLKIMKLVLIKNESGLKYRTDEMPATSSSPKVTLKWFWQS